jgi:hypothetical protein
MQHVVRFPDQLCPRPLFATAEPGHEPSRALVAAAIAGLLSLGGAGCDSAGSEGEITSSTVVTDMTLERFTADCDERDGTVELHAHCGGLNTCKGFSYDDATHVLTEHTCRALNTCSGYSCVVGG